jgi:hypothetical protein
VLRPVLNGAGSAAPFGRLNFQKSADRPPSGCLESCDKGKFDPEGSHAQRRNLSQNEQEGPSPPSDTHCRGVGGRGTPHSGPVGPVEGIQDRFDSLTLSKGHVVEPPGGSNIVEGAGPRGPGAVVGPNQPASRPENGVFPRHPSTFAKLTLTSNSMTRSAVGSAHGLPLGG